MSFLRSPLVQHLLGILQVVSACFMAWKGACLLSGTPYPAVVVITNSMAPAFDPGDILLVHRHPAHDRRVRVGDLPVILNPDRPFPFIHRVIGVFYDDNQEYVCFGLLNGLSERLLICMQGDGVDQR